MLIELSPYIAIELNPKYKWDYNNRGLTYHKLKQYDEALADYAKSIDLDVKYSWPYYNRACIYVLQGQFETALGSLSQALEFSSNPNHYLSVIATNPDFDSIRDDPRFQQLLAEFS